MEELSLLSDSTGISRSCRIDHMAFLRDAIGLDPISAGMFYQAERLQGKGQFRQAVKYYERILLTYPNCVEAITAITIILEAKMLDQAERLQEKGQLRQAVKYYERILLSHPNCVEAITAITIIKEVRVLNDEEKETNKKREEEQVHKVFAMITLLAIYYITIVQEIIGM